MIDNNIDFDTPLTLNLPGRAVKIPKDTDAVVVDDKQRKRDHVVIWSGSHDWDERDEPIDDEISTVWDVISPKIPDRIFNGAYTLAQLNALINRHGDGTILVPAPSTFTPGDAGKDRGDAKGNPIDMAAAYRLVSKLIGDAP